MRIVKVSGGNMVAMAEDLRFFTSSQQKTLLLERAYTDRILALAAFIPRLGSLQFPHGSASASARPCGSRVKVDVRLNKGIIIAFAHEVESCTLGRAASSLMAQNVIGSSSDELHELSHGVREMLKGSHVELTDKWIGLQCLSSLSPFRERHASILLTFDTTCEAVERALKKL